MYMRFVLPAFCALLGSGCTLDVFFFGYTKQDGPYELSDAIIPKDRYDQERFVLAADGNRGHVLYVKPSAKDPERARWAIFYCHGNGGNIGIRRHFSRVEAFYQMGYAVLGMEYRGYGRSEGKPTEPGLYLDADAAMAELLSKEGVSRERVVLYGHSLGAAVCTDLAHRNRGRFAGLILEAPFRSAQDLVWDSSHSSLSTHMVSDLSFDNFDKIDKIDMPLFIMHGTEDTYLLPRYGQELYQQAQNPKSLWLVEGADHVNIPSDAGTPMRQAFADRVTAFVDAK